MPARSLRPLRAVCVAAMAVAGLALLGGCDERPTATTSATPPSATGGHAAAGAGTAISADGTWRVAWRTEPPVIPLDAPFAVEVTITPAAASAPASPDAGAPPADLDFSIDARMPHHRHGMLVRPDVRRTGPGRFRAEGLLLHMPGYWELHFDVVTGGVVERAQSSFEIDG